MLIGAMNNPRRDIYEEILQIASEGFDFIDLTIEPPQSGELDISKLKRLIKETGLKSVGHTNPTIPAIYPLPEIHRASVAEIKRTADIFAELGFSRMNIHPFYYATNVMDEYKVEANIALLKEISRHCRQLGLELMLENFLSPFDTPGIFQRILGEVPDLNIHIDVGHTNIGHYAPDLVQEFFDKFGKKIIHMHVHDNRGDADQHLPIGCGDIDWPEIIPIIKNAGYDNTITLEIFCSDRDYLLLSQKKLRKWWERY